MKTDLLTLQEIRSVYRRRMKRDFPDNELKPLAMIEKSICNGHYLCYGLREDTGLLAYAFFVRTGDLYMFDYFAVREDLRGTGVGSVFLRELCGCSLREASCVLLEVDDPAFADSEEEKALRERRLRFYLKNGLRDTTAKVRTFGVDFMLLEFPMGEPLGPEDAVDRYSRIYRSVLPERICDRMVRIKNPV